jgi:predicted hotdog family 3-hydroxylacyl-ACP dehydratase
MLAAPILDHAWIAAHIPHSGDMCLLNTVIAWNQSGIRCDAISHHSPSNPLRFNGQLSAVCGIEYAAQAMAVHGALIAPTDNTNPRVGYLVSIRSTKVNVARLDTITHPLVLNAECLTASANNMMYEFMVMASDQILISGRAAIILDSKGRQ